MYIWICPVFFLKIHYYYYYYYYYLPCAILICCTVLYMYYFSLQILPRLFSNCIITPVHFFDILCLLVPLYPPSTIWFFFSCTFIPFSRVSVKHEMCIYQLSSSQLYKMAIKNPQKNILWKNNEIIYLSKMQILMYFTYVYRCWNLNLFFWLCHFFYLLPNIDQNKKLLLVTKDGIC